MELAGQAIKLPKGCPNPYAKVPDGMRPVALDIMVNTKTDPDGLLPTVMFGQGWEYIGPDGTSINATGGSSSPCEYDPPQLKPNRKYTATIWMSLPADAATDGNAALVWNQSLGSPGPGYEWNPAAA